jgi:hypothetical protein
MFFITIFAKTHIFNNVNYYKNMLHNVPAVTDGFLRPIRKNAKHFTGAKNCGGAKRHKGRKPDWCFA